MAMLPTEIVLDEILPKLPVKSLLRFKSISKEFDTLISSPKFVLHHLRQSLSSATNRLLITAGKGKVHSFDLDLPENPPIPLPLPDFFIPSYDNCIIGCCNGLLLIGGSGVVFLLINPSTGFSTTIRSIPMTSGPVYSNRFVFGYDAVNDDYKIAAIEGHHIAVLNLSDKLWRNVENPRVDYVVSGSGGPVDAVVYDNHLYHWLFWCELQKKHRIVCFDLCIENWTRDIPLPNYNNSDDNSGEEKHFAELLFDNHRDERNDVTGLQVLNGFLSVLTRNDDDNSGDGYHVWIMKEYRIKESWVKLFGFSDTRCTPFAFGRGSNSKVLCKIHSSRGFRLKWYNVRRKEYKNAEIHDGHGISRLYEACVVNGSLVSVPGGERIHGDLQGKKRRR